MANKKLYPCDTPDNDGVYRCPFAYDENSYVSCYDMCGLGAYEEEEPREEFEEE